MFEFHVLEIFSLFLRVSLTALRDPVLSTVSYIVLFAEQ